MLAAINKKYISMVDSVIYILYTRKWVQMTIGLIVLFINAGLLFLIIGMEYVGLIMILLLSIVAIIIVKIYVANKLRIEGRMIVLMGIILMYIAYENSYLVLSCGEIFWQLAPQKILVLWYSHGLLMYKEVILFPNEVMALLNITDPEFAKGCLETGRGYGKIDMSIGKEGIQNQIEIFKNNISSYLNENQKVSTGKKMFIITNIGVVLYLIYKGIKRYYLW